MVGQLSTKNIATGLVLGFLLLSYCSFSAGETDPIQKLILKLGSDHFAERQHAMRELDTLGSAALAALQKANQSADPEIRRRSAELVEKIEKRILSARLLEPKKIHLVYRDVPLSQAIDDFAKKSGYGIKYQRNINAANRTLNLDTGELPFWDAWELFCRKADVMDRSLSSNNASKLRMPELDRLREQELRRFILEEQMLGINGNYPVPPSALSLVDGKAPVLPLCRSGAVRIQALSPDLSFLRIPVKDDEFQLVLEITPEPKLAWKKVIDVRIEQAIDDMDHQLIFVPEALQSTSDYEVELRTRWLVNGKTSDQELIADSLRQYALRFKSGKSKPVRIKELKGTVAAQVDTPPEDLVSIDNIFQALGKTIKGKDGLMVTLTQLETDQSGSVRVQLELQTPPPPGADRVIMGRGVRRARLGGAFIETSGWAGPGNISFLDSRGKTISLNRTSSHSIWKGNEVVQIYSASFQQPKGGGEFVKFVYSGQRTVVIDVPFVLKDVPVP
jgi:hypothetical protein